MNIKRIELIKTAILLAVLAFVILLSGCSSLQSLSQTNKEEIIEIGRQELGLEVKVMLDELDVNKVYVQSGYDLKGRVGAFGDGYKIKLTNGLVNREVVQVLAHELIHVKQYSTGQLQRTSKDIMRYKGRDYKHEHLSYNERKWEIDAKREGDILARKIRTILKER